MIHKLRKSIIAISINIHTLTFLFLSGFDSISPRCQTFLWRTAQSWPFSNSCGSSSKSFADGLPKTSLRKKFNHNVNQFTLMRCLGESFSTSIDPWYAWACHIVRLDESKISMDWSAHTRWSIPRRRWCCPHISMAMQLVDRLRRLTRDRYANHPMDL